MSKKKRFAWESIPIINYANVLEDQESEDFLTTLKEMHFAHGEEGSVEFHRNCLGKQLLCWDGDYRFWVWEGKNWRVFASNKAGTSFEVRVGLSKEKALATFDDYRKLVGLNK